MAVEYRFFIDWRKDGLLNVSDFEDGTVQGWEAFGTQPPQLESQSNFFFTGSRGLGIGWIEFQPFTFGSSTLGFDTGRFGSSNFSNSAEVFRFGDVSYGFDSGRFGYAEVADPTVLAPYISKQVDKLVPGENYTLEVMAYFAGGSGMPIDVELDGHIASSPTTPSTWHLISVPFTAVSDTHTIVIRPQTPPTVFDYTYIDRVRILGQHVEVTNRVMIDGISFASGRDQARNLDDVQPGAMALKLINTDARFTPDNPASPIYGHVDPGKEVIVDAVKGGKEYRMFRGYIDDMKLITGQTPNLVEIGCTDMLGRLAEQEVSTEVFPVLRSGEAVHKVLDAAGWPSEHRDIDPGASTFKMWHAESESALSSLKEIMESEGLPSIFFIDDRGYFVFRDRHHRLTRTRSINTQAEYTHKFDEDVSAFRVRFQSEHWEYDLGFEDVVNSVTCEVKERVPQQEEVVWNDENFHKIIPNLGVEKFTIDTNSPVIQAVAPVKGVDFESYDVGEPEVTLNRTSGSKIEVSIRAVGGAITVVGMQVRATPIAEVDYSVKVEDQASIDRFGLKSFQLPAPMANREDVFAVASVLIGHRAQRLPTLSFSIKGNEDKFWEESHYLNRRISDRVRVIEPESFTDHDFYIERIEREPIAKGIVNEAIFGAERTVQQFDNVFTFDDVNLGFDNGVFGLTGMTSPATVFVLDSSKLDEHLLGF